MMWSKALRRYLRAAWMRSAPSSSRATFDDWLDDNRARLREELGLPNPYPLGIWIKDVLG